MNPSASGSFRCYTKGRNDMLGTILIIVLILILLGSLPTWGHSRNWGYGPSGLLGTILVVVIILVLLKYI
jgi:hypothetical protein